MQEFCLLTESQKVSRNEVQCDIPFNCPLAIILLTCLLTYLINYLLTYLDSPDIASIVSCWSQSSVMHTHELHQNCD